MNRRQFIKQTAIGLGAITVPLSVTPSDYDLFLEARPELMKSAKNTLDLCLNDPALRQALKWA